MSIVKRSISVTDEQHAWVKQQIALGNYGNESEVFRDLIRKEREREDKIAQLQRLITEGIESGYSEKTVSQIWAEARQKYETQNG